LQSLRGQTLADFEVIVVDAQSNDGSVEMVRHEFPECILINAGNIGPIRANNLGLYTATGEYVVLDLNSDDVVSSSWLANLLGVMERDNSIGIAGGKRYVYGSNRIDSVGGSIDFFTASTPALGVRRRAPSDLIVDVDYVPVMMMRKRIIKEIGVLDEVYEFYFEEPDICLRAKRAGYRIVSVTTAVHWHYGSASIGMFSRRKYYYMRRNQIRFAMKNFPLRYLPVCLLWLIVARTLLDLLSTMPLIRAFAMMASPHSFWANSTVKLVLAQFGAIRWNLVHARETFTERAVTSLREKKPL